MTRKILEGNFPVSSDVNSKKDSVAYKQTLAYDSNGELLYDITRKAQKPNGSGFVISYTEKICDLLTKIRTGSVLRVFFYLAHNQQFGNDGKTYGFRCSKKYLSQVLQIERTVLWDALKTLRENYLVLESVVDGQSEFMVNPSYVTIGQSKKERLREWSRRWEEYFKKTGGKL